MEEKQSLSYRAISGRVWYHPFLQVRELIVAISRGANCAVARLQSVWPLRLAVAGTVLALPAMLQVRGEPTLACNDNCGGAKLSVARVAARIHAPNWSPEYVATPDYHHGMLANCSASIITRSVVWPVRPLAQSLS